MDDKTAACLLWAVESSRVTCISHDRDWMIVPIVSGGWQVWHIEFIRSKSVSLSTAMSTPIQDVLKERLPMLFLVI